MCLRAYLKTSLFSVDFGAHECKDYWLLKQWGLEASPFMCDYVSGDTECAVLRQSQKMTVPSDYNVLTV